MRISDWSSDVCSSDLGAPERDAVKEPEASCYDRPALVETPAARARRMLSMNDPLPDRTTALDLGEAGPFSAERRDLLPRWRQLLSCERESWADRKSDVSGKRVSGRGDLGGRRIL